MDRRNFLFKSTLAATSIGLGVNPLDSFAASNKRITILHTNDMHSRIEPFKAGRNIGLGGMAKRASLIEQIRKQEPNVLLLDAGDIFQGTPYFNFFGGELELKLMSQMKYDAATMGNHDFDAGVEGFIKQLPNANFPFLVANYKFDEDILKKEIKPYKIFKRAGLKVGVFGLGIQLEGLVPKKHYKNTEYVDPIGIAKNIVQELKAKKCDLVVCLSHLGNKYRHDKVDDKKLAESVNGIDLIIGGHTHTFLKKPISYKSPDGNDVIVNQVGWAGINLGRVDFDFSPVSGKKAVDGYAIAIKEDLREKI